MHGPGGEREGDADGVVPDVIAPGLAVLFCGINPGLRSAVLGQHFAHPANRFWKVLHGAGLTPRVLTPGEPQALLSVGIGITNLVARPTRTAGELTAAELRAGAVDLESRARRFRPGIVAVVGMGAYRQAFRRPRAMVGLQEARLGPSRLWLLPNPSGLQARYQMDDLVEAYGALREAATGANRQAGRELPDQPPPVTPSAPATGRRDGGRGRPGPLPAPAR